MLILSVSEGCSPSPTPRLCPKRVRDFNYPQRDERCLLRDYSSSLFVDFTIQGQLKQIDLLEALRDSQPNYIALTGTITFILTDRPPKAHAVESRKPNFNKNLEKNFRAQGKKFEKKSAKNGLEEVNPRLRSENELGKYNLTWNIDYQVENLFDLGEGIEILDVQLDQIYTLKTRFYNTSSSMCFSKNFLVKKSKNVKYTTTEDQCKRVKEVSLPVKDKTMDMNVLRTYYSGYMENFGVFKLTVLGGKKLNHSITEATFDLKNTPVGNPLLSFKYYFRGDISNYNQIPFSLLMFYEKGSNIAHDTGSGLQKYVFVRNCDGPVCYGENSNTLAIPDLGGIEKRKMLNIDCILVEVHPSEPNVARDKGYRGDRDPQLVYNVFCVVLYLKTDQTGSEQSREKNEALQTEAWVLRARVNGGDQNFTTMMIPADLLVDGEQLLHIGFIDNESQLRISGLLNTNPRRKTYMIFENSIRFCDIPKDVYNDPDGYLLLVVDFCHTYNITEKFSFNPLEEAIEKFDVFGDLADPFLSRMDNTNIPAAYARIVKKRAQQNQGDEIREENDVRVEVISFVEKLTYPNVSATDFLILNNYRNQLLISKKGSLLSVKTPPEGQAIPYFGYKADQEGEIATPGAKARPRTSKNRTKELDDMTNFDANLMIQGAKNQPKKEVYITFTRSEPITEPTILEFKIQKNPSEAPLLRLNYWNYTTVFFSRPITCSGMVIKNMKSNLTKKYDVKLQPFTPAYGLYFYHMPLRAHNITDSKDVGKSKISQNYRRLERFLTSTSRILTENSSSDPEKKKEKRLGPIDVNLDIQLLSTGGVINTIKLNNKNISVSAGLDNSQDFKIPLNRAHSFFNFVELVRRKNQTAQPILFVPPDYSWYTGNSMVASRDMMDYPAFRGRSSFNFPVQKGRELDICAFSQPEEGSKCYLFIRLYSETCFLFIKPKSKFWEKDQNSKESVGKGELRRDEKEDRKEKGGQRSRKGGKKFEKSKIDYVGISVQNALNSCYLRNVT